MAKVVTTVNSTSTTDAQFRTWGSAVSAAISAAGMVQTSDTGQINWTTVTKPAGSSTFQGYEIWRFADSLQSTSPVFIKVEYGSSGGSANSVAVRLGVGSATNGAGSLSGLATAQFTTGIAASGSSASDQTATPVYACHTAGSFFLWIGQFFTGNNGHLTCMFSVSRTVDTTGALTADGLYIWVRFFTTPYSGYIDYTNSSVLTPALATSQWPAAAPTLGLKGYDGNNKSYVLPHYCHPTSLNPGIAVGVLSTRTFAGTTGGLGQLQTFSCKPAGPSSSVAHTYLVIGDGATQNNLDYPSGPNWEQSTSTQTVSSNASAWSGAAFLWE